MPIFNRSTEKKNAAKEKKKARKESRADKKDARQDARESKKDARKDKREDLKEIRKSGVKGKEKREQKKDVRQDAKDEIKTAKGTKKKEIKSANTTKRKKIDRANEIDKMKIKSAPIISFERDVMVNLGRPYGLKTKEDRDKFKEMWKVVRHAKKLKNEIPITLKEEVVESYKRLGRAVAGQRVSTRGHGKIKNLDVKSGPFVIFSDLHMAKKGHPVDFFYRKNRRLYSKVLKHYSKQDYTLVENGDVEELIIMDLSPDETKTFWKTLKTANYFTERELRRVGYFALRQKYRMREFRGILRDYSDLYDQINKDFHSKGKLVRLAGNHDQDLQDPEFEKVLRTVYPNIKVYDYLFLKSSSRSSRSMSAGKGKGTSKTVDYVIGHGHQFDAATTPKYARRLGEVLSECMSWGFQGPDRDWKWVDDCHKWMVDGEPFINRIVESASGNIAEGAANDILKQILANSGRSKNSRRLNAKDSAMKAAVESAVGYNIAWDYFESSSVVDAFFDEVLTGNEFFKLRHLDETILEKEYPKAVKSNGKTPKLVIGHTHEVRQNAIGKGRKALDCYLNSGAAGRFEKLLWAIEIKDGKEIVVGWTLDSLGAPQRKVFKPERGKLVPQ